MARKHDLNAPGSINSMSCVETVEEVFGTLKTPPKKNLSVFDQVAENLGKFLNKELDYEIRRLMGTHDIHLNLKAVPWAAPKLSKKGVYDIRGKEKQWLRWLIKEQWPRAPIPGPVEVHFKFGFKSKKPSEYHTKKPDCTNMQKLAEDCLNKIVIEDDRQVFKISAEKYYAADDHIHIVIVEHICH